MGLLAEFQPEPLLLTFLMTDGDRENSEEVSSSGAIVIITQRIQKKYSVT